MEHFTLGLALAAAPAAVYAALTTPEGLASWWSEDSALDTRPGGTLLFRFGPNWKQMRVEQLVPNALVQWQCTGAHIDALVEKDEWVGTHVVFRLQATASGGTRLDFEHVGLVPGFECYGVCQRGWQYFLASLQQYADTGRGTPWTLVAAATAA